MSVSQSLLGNKLQGKRVPGGWHVVKKLLNQLPNTGGLYSTGYVVEHENGRRAFLKATDCSLMCTSTDDMAAAILMTASSYESEKKILEYCRGNNMDRIVTPLDFGSSMEAFNGTKEPLFWIVFELAKSDARQQINAVKAFDFNWALHAMHNLSVATKQLHSADVSHNDIKPSNLLIFTDKEQKLGDLGSATSPKFPQIRDQKYCAGDPRYAAPENLYVNASTFGSPLFNQRKAGDLYLLGSMGMFLLSMPMTTSYLLQKLDPVHRPMNDKGVGWSGDFRGVLPYWNTVFAEMIVELRDRLPKTEDGKITKAGADYLSVIQQLCDPDPSHRGHPDNRSPTSDIYSVERYISTFDRLRLTEMIAANAN